MTTGKNWAVAMIAANVYADRIDALRASGATLQEEAHVLGVQALLHCEACGDTGPAKRLVEALPKAVRRQDLVVWLKAFSPVYIVLDGKSGAVTSAKLLKEGEKFFKPFDIDAADETPFYDHSRDDAPKEPLTLAALLKMIGGAADRAEKIAKGENEKQPYKGNKANALKVIRAVQEALEGAPANAA